MPMAATMATVLRFVLTDITAMLRTPVPRTGTMARRGLAVESLLEPARGIGMPIMAAAITDTVATAMVAVMAMDMDAAMDIAGGMDMAMATDTDMAGTADITVATAVDSMAAVMVADTGNSAD